MVKSAFSTSFAVDTGTSVSYIEFIVVIDESYILWQGNVSLV